MKGDRLEIEPLSGSAANEAAIQYFRRLADTAFWGVLTLKLEAGRVVHLRKEENLKPAELSGKPEFGRDQP